MERTDRLSPNFCLTSFRYVFRMFSTRKTKQYWYLSRQARTLANNRSVSSLPFFSVLERCTTLARLDFGIVWSLDVRACGLAYVVYGGGCSSLVGFGSWWDLFLQWGRRITRAQRRFWRLELLYFVSQFNGKTFPSCVSSWNRSIARHNKSFNGNSWSYLYVLQELYVNLSEATTSSQDSVFFSSSSLKLTVHFSTLDYTSSYGT